MAIKAVLFDLGETLLSYGEMNVNALFRDGARLTYEYLKKCGDGRLPGFFWYNLGHLFSIRWRYAVSVVTLREFDCMALLERKARAMGFRLSAE